MVRKMMVLIMIAVAATTDSGIHIHAGPKEEG